MLKSIKPSTSILSDYLYSNVSFSTFKFDELSLLACKYYLSKIGFFRKRTLIKLHSILEGDKESEDNFRKEIYYCSQIIKALKNSSILLSTNQKEIKIYRKVKKNNVVVAPEFCITDLSFENYNKKACLFIYKDKDIDDNRELISSFRELKIINVNELENEGLIYDQIKVKILQDDSEIYFVSKGIYSNYIVDSIFGVNKIGINL